jgi:hypothetical protein
MFATQSGRYTKIYDKQAGRLAALSPTSLRHHNKGKYSGKNRSRFKSVGNHAEILENGPSTAGFVNQRSPAVRFHNFGDKKFSVPDPTGQSDVHYPKETFHLQTHEDVEEYRIQKLNSNLESLEQGKQVAADQEQYFQAMRNIRSEMKPLGASSLLPPIQHQLNIQAQEQLDFRAGHGDGGHVNIF